jgi:hypothetical protein
VNIFLENHFSINLGTDNMVDMPLNVLNELRGLILRFIDQNFHINPIKDLKMISSNLSKTSGLETGCIKKGY